MELCLLRKNKALVGGENAAGTIAGGLITTALSKWEDKDLLEENAANATAGAFIKRALSAWKDKDLAGRDCRWCHCRCIDYNNFICVVRLRSVRSECSECHCRSIHCNNSICLGS